MTGSDATRLDPPQMDRRSFLKTAALAGGVACLPVAAAGAEAGAGGATASPAGASSDDLPQRRIEVDGFHLNVVDVGTGPAVLLLHGFPSNLFDWRHQIAALVEQGYRAIACDLLGLGRSDKPVEPEHYTTARDVDRTLALVRALGVKQARVVCHDRGAGIGWQLAAHHPELVQQLVALTVGHPNGGRNPSVEQREKSWYMLFFQYPIAEEALRRDDWALFRAWLRSHPAADAWIRDLTPPGALTAGLGWYRANRRPDAPPPPPTPDVAVPTLGLWATEDHYLLPEYVLESYRWVRAPWRAERIDGASHFMMLDRPAQVTRLVLEFFRGGEGARAGR